MEGEKPTSGGAQFRYQIRENDKSYVCRSRETPSLLSTPWVRHVV